ncbi:MAG: RidA family protein [Gracilimonas sp.]|nr:RidA family protein [Gracilimonas sp.]
MKRRNYSSGAKWEDLVGYSRAVRVGDQIYISGTTAVDEQGNVVGKGDLYTQTVQCIKNIEKALSKAGASLENVVRTRIFVTNIEDWESFGKAHEEFFGSIKPAATLVEVSKLIHPDLIVEMEVDAVISGPDQNQI